MDLGASPSPNTLSCIRAFGGMGFLFRAVWAASPLLKKKIQADYDQLLRAVFSCFQGQKKYLKSI